MGTGQRSFEETWCHCTRFDQPRIEPQTSRVELPQPAGLLQQSPLAPRSDKQTDTSTVVGQETTWYVKFQNQAQSCIAHRQLTCVFIWTWGWKKRSEGAWGGTRWAGGVRLRRRWNSISSSYKSKLFWYWSQISSSYNLEYSQKH